MAVKFIENYDIFLFDLDNTLYNEDDFLQQVYKNFAVSLSEKTVYSANIIYEWLILRKKLIGREGIFENLISDFGIVSKKEDLLSLFRSSMTGIKLKTFSYVEPLLREIIDNGKEVYIVTNGYPLQQRLKIDVLGLAKFKMTVIYASEIAPKPDPNLFLYLKNEHFKDFSKKIIFIGDSIVDKEFAVSASIDFLNVVELFKYSLKE